jgi:hypothetical protein
MEEPKAGSFITKMDNELLVRINKETENLQDVLAPSFNTLNLSELQNILEKNNYPQEIIEELKTAIKAHQSTLTAKRIALKSLFSKIAECKELAQIVYGKEIKLDVMFTHE